jgi:hypothetical protein
VSESQLLGNGAKKQEGQPEQEQVFGDVAAQRTIEPPRTANPEQKRQAASLKPSQSDKEIMGVKKNQKLSKN